MRSHTNICVIESRWWEAKNTSVRGIFDLLSDIHTHSHNGYEYEMANSRAGFQEVVERQLTNPKCNYLTIATHGSHKGLKLFNEEGISRAMIRNILKRDERGRNLVGLHLGCCSFLDERLADFLFERDISPWWIAGYGHTVSWVEATSLDFLFFNKLLEHDDNFKSPIKTIKRVADMLRKECGGLVEKLDFQIYTGVPDKFVEKLL